VTYTLMALFTFQQASRERAISEVVPLSPAAGHAGGWCFRGVSILRSSKPLRRRMWEGRTERVVLLKARRWLMAHDARSLSTHCVPGWRPIRPKD